MGSNAATSPAIPTSTNANSEEILRVYELQQKNLANARGTSIDARLKKIKQLEKTVLANRKKIEDAVFADFRKAPIQTDFSEIYPVVAECRLLQSKLHDWIAPHEVETPLVFFGSSAKIVLEPKGRVLILSPWNYPFQIPIKNMLAAYAAGNVIIIKPSEFTPHTSRCVKEILAEVFSENEVAVLEGDHATSQALLNLRFDHIHFTGAPSVGKIIMKAASETLTSVTLELGGKSPVIIDETANVKKAARNIVWSKFLNVGQTCVAADYVYVHESKRDEFVAQMKTQIEKAFGSDAKSNVSYCRMVNAKHFSRVNRLLEDAVSKGAKVENGGATDASENYIAPTVLTNVKYDMLLMQEEIFGPLLPVLSYKNVEEVIAHINANEKPLSLYIYSSSSKNQERIINSTSSGAVCINEAMIQNGHPGLPFGGVNNSGIGKSHGIWGFKEFCNEKPVLKAWNAPSDLLTPPYGKLNEVAVEAMLKFL